MKETFMFDIAVIGNGASAVATLKALNFLSTTYNIPIKICIIGKIANMGYGIVYNEDNDYAIMNTPISNISIDSEDPLDFIKWAKKKGFYFLENHNIPRRIYGKYLNDSLINLHEKEHIKLIDSIAHDINHNNNDEYEVITHSNNRIVSKYIILCTGLGSLKLNDFYGLSGHDRFIYNPYPLHHQLSLIDKNEDIMIIGSGLTAVDIAVCLYQQHHQGKIIICSREGRLPLVKATVKAYIPKWCRFDHFLQIFQEQNNYLSLRQILRLIRRELRSVNANWIDIFFPKKSDTALTFNEKINSAKKGLPWLDILIGIQHEIDQAWIYVKNEHKAIFIEKYLSSILKVIAPMPLINANIVNKLFTNNHLEIISGINSIQNIYEGFIINRSNNLSFQVDRIINATGFSRAINLKDESLITNLVKKNIISLHSCDGIKVCAKTGRIIPLKNIFAVGHLTMGEHPLINNIECIVMNAKVTAATIIDDFNTQNTGQYA